ncbi:MAG: hypothetical protein KDC82_09055 [Bacteroidetes bacterium]|nr:hypothetical protein [Bacteroidota bacterium]
MQAKLINFFSLLLALVLCTALEAQTFSPQSQFGLGNMHSSLFSSNRAMGGISAGFRGSRDINYLNPASYSAINYTTFDIGLSLYGNVVSDSARITDAANGGINHIALAVPIKQNLWGMAFGLLPYSYKNYSFNSIIEEDGQSYEYKQQGKGSTYQVFWGNGFQFKGLSAGVNAGFLFGQFDDSENFLFPDSLGNLNTSKHNEVRLKDFLFNFGLQYQVKLNKLENTDKEKQDVFMTIGAYGAPSFNIKSLTSVYSNSSLTSAVTGEEIAIDSALNGLYDVKEQTALPAYFGAGISFGNEFTWMTGIDFHFENWKNFSSPISSSPMSNEWQVKIGGQILPNFKSKKFGNNVSYRLGAHLGKSRIMLDNQAVPDFGMTFGFGIPFGKISTFNRSFSNLNLSVEIGRRGLNQNDAQKENYYKVVLAYSLSDRWFIKRKFD